MTEKMDDQKFSFAILRNDMNKYQEAFTGTRTDGTLHCAPGKLRSLCSPKNRKMIRRWRTQRKFNQGYYAGKQIKIFQTVLICFFAGIFFSNSLLAQDKDQKKSVTKILYGTASFYADKFEGRKTANGEKFKQKKMTAACNVLPLGTWIRVTNLRNKKTVIVKVNDRLHHKMKRIVDLSSAAATKLNFIKSGLTKVKVEVLGKKKPD